MTPPTTPPNSGFTSAQLREIAAAMQQPLKELEARFGIQIRYTGGTYGPTASVKFELSRISGSGFAETKERIAFRRHAAELGLSPEMLDETFVHERTTYRIAGLMLRAASNPVLAESTKNGKLYRFGPDTVKLLLRQSS